MDGSVFLVFCPSGTWIVSSSFRIVEQVSEIGLTGNVSPDNSFNLDDFTFLDNHASSFELITVLIE